VVGYQWRTTPKDGGAQQQGSAEVMKLLTNKAAQQQRPSVVDALRLESTAPRIAKLANANIADGLARLLASTGVERAFGISGGAVAPFCEALGRSNIEVVHFRSETGAAFAAMESYFADGHPVVVFATTGPGLINALNGIIASRWEGAKVILVSGTTPVGKRGRWAFQETSPYTLPHEGLFTAGTIFQFATEMQSAAELSEVALRLRSGLARANGFVAHVGVPIDLQTAPSPPIDLELNPSFAPHACPPRTVERCAERLATGSFVIWVGFGARNADSLVRTLAERTGAPVMCSPRAKGIFPENHPQFIGVTGFGGHSTTIEYIRRNRPDHILVLGSRLGEFTSFWDPDLTPRLGFIHVDLDVNVPGVAYPEVKTTGVCAEISQFLQGLLDRLVMPPPAEATFLGPEFDRPAPRPEGKVRPQLLMAAIQDRIVDRSDAIVMTEAGNSFAWSNHYLQFRDAKRYRVSVGYGSMGNAVAGVVGAALASAGKAVAIVGDGAMLMFSEVSTAVSHQIKAVWIVLNDSRYGMIEQGMRAQGLKPVETSIPTCDFVAIARGMGADGVRVEREVDVESALEKAMMAEGPFVVDVMVDPTETAPFLRRIESLLEQGARPTGRRK
jgi:acetolactate synthase-1/2/3 large subunit